MGEVAAEPVRDARRKCRDDDLVERAGLDRLLDRGERIAVADGPLDVPTRGLVEKRQGELERGRRLLGLRVPVGTRHQQREAAEGAAGTRAHRVEQPRRGRSSVSHHQHARGRCRGHPPTIVAPLLR
jgi:hypothetical protein